MKIYVMLAALAGSALAAAPASAVQIFSTSYAMPNGNGQAVGGSYNYWDVAYSGSGSTTTDGAALSGGSGDLTDGVTTTATWNTVENGAGTGPYVGWYKPSIADPTINFAFGAGNTIDTVRIWADNSGIGGVFGPADILIDGVSQTYTLPTAGTAGSFDITGLSLTGTGHSIQFKQAGGAWVFVNEVEFFGSVVGNVPEPAAWAMLIGGFGLLGAVSRRRKSSAVFA
jgi:hypothetical protein